MAWKCRQEWASHHRVLVHVPEVQTKRGDLLMKHCSMLLLVDKKLNCVPLMFCLYPHHKECCFYCLIFHSKHLLSILTFSREAYKYTSTVNQNKDDFFFSPDKHAEGFKIVFHPRVVELPVRQAPTSPTNQRFRAVWLLSAAVIQEYNSGWNYKIRNCRFWLWD